MSTKIYDAFEWTGGSIEELLAILTRFRTLVFKKSVQEAASRFSASEFKLVEYIDDVREAMKSGMCFTKKGNFNPSCSATVHFYKGRIFVIFFGISRPTRLPPSKKMKDFHYQNQTDREDGITDEEWTEREKVWDAIFKKDDRPGHAGFVFEIIDDSDSVRLAYALFEKIHGHKAGVPGNCIFCNKAKSEARS